MPKQNQPKKSTATIEFAEDQNDIPKEFFKKNPMGKLISTATKQTIMNVYSSLCASYPKESLGRIVKKTAQMTGVSAQTVWRAKKEHQQCGGKFKERVPKPRSSLGRKVRMSKFEKPVLEALTKKVLDFVAVSEKPSCKKIFEAINADNTLPRFQSICTFRRLLCDLGFDSNYELSHTPPESTSTPPAPQPVKKHKGRQTVHIPENPYKLAPVNAKDFNVAEIVYRSDNILLCKRNQTGDKFYYETCFENPHPNPQPGSPQAYSLFRSEMKPEATNMYLFLKKILPHFIPCFNDIFKKDLLQEICDIANQHTTWTAAHIAAFKGWTKCFQSESFLKLINEPCSETLVTPIHIAIQRKRPDVIQTLIHMSAQLNAVDKKGNTVFHYAANSTKEIIQALCYWETPALINKVNIDGSTALQIACISNNAPCISALLDAGADMNSHLVNNNAPLEYSVDPMSEALRDKEICNDPMQLYNKNGTTLHLAESPECLEALIDFGCHLDATNYNGDTALHIFVMKNKLSCVVTLLSSGANPNVITADGSSCLHIAAKIGDIPLMQALIIFGANPNIKNAEGFTPRHLASTTNHANKDFLVFILNSARAIRCATMCPTCDRGCAFNSNYNGLPPPKLSQVEVPRLFDGVLGLPTPMPNFIRKNALKRRCRILCLDGGGIRALVLIEILAALEHAMGCSVLKYFDLVSGTGTGGLLALALSLGKSVEYCRGLMFKLRNKLFTGYKTFDPEALHKFLKKEFGEVVTLSEIKFGRIMVTGICGERQPPELRLFRNFVSARTILNQPTDMGFDHHGQYAWHVARAACSLYLHNPEKYELGGLISTNPVIDSLTEIHERNLALKATHHDDDMEDIASVISLGSGLLPIRMNLQSQRLVDKMSQIESRIVEKGSAMCSLLEIPYFRLNPPLTEMVSPEETDPVVLVGMLWECIIYLNSQESELQELAKIIKQL